MKGYYTLSDSGLYGNLTPEGKSLLEIDVNNIAQIEFNEGFSAGIKYMCIGAAVGVLTYAGVTLIEAIYKDHKRKQSAKFVKDFINSCEEEKKED